MVILYSLRFERELNQIHATIAMDSKSRADNFCDEIINHLKMLEYAPLIGRPKKNNRRELIYKQYIIPYAIKTDYIAILGIYKQNVWRE